MLSFAAQAFQNLIATINIVFYICLMLQCVVYVIDPSENKELLDAVVLIV